jgi:LysM repeat protein
MLPFIFINVLVSATVVFGILFWWENRQEEPGDGVAQQTAVAPTAPLAFADDTLAQPLPDPTATSEPESETPIHIVRSGDTLMNISQLYDVSMDDIMAVNGITNPNILAVGQELLIPVGGIPTPTPEPTSPPQPTVVPSPNPTVTLELEGEAQLEITAVLGAGNLAEEAVQLVNSGSRQIALLNWTLRDEDGYVYTFGQFTLFGAGSGVLIHTETGEDTATDRYWGLEEPIWRSGERAVLLDSEGNIQATFTIPSN